MATGSTKDPMVMSGCLTSFTQIGVLTIMADGFGIRYAAGLGLPTSLGAGVFTTMADGTGGLDWAGTGFLPATGDLRGSIGIGVMIISVGVR